MTKPSPKLDGKNQLFIGDAYKLIDGGLTKCTAWDDILYAVIINITPETIVFARPGLKFNIEISNDQTSHGENGR